MSFEVDDIQTSDKQTAEGEKVRAQAMAESMAQQFSVQAIQQMAKISGPARQIFLNPYFETIKTPSIPAFFLYFCVYLGVVLKLIAYRYE